MARLSPARRRPSRWTSRAQGRAFSALAAAALLIGVLLAWALPALAHDGRNGRGRSAALAGVATVRATTRSGTVAHTGTSTSAKTTTSAQTTTTTVVTPKPYGWMGKWARPVTVQAAIPQDLIAPIVGVSSSNAVAVGSGTTDEDAPQAARANVLTGAATGGFTKHPLGQTQQTLAVGYLGNQLVLLNGASTPTYACCSDSTARVMSTPSTFGADQPIASNLEGPTLGALVNVTGGLMAVVDNQAGITVSRSDAQGNFGASEALVASDPTPPLMAATSLADGGAAIVWTAPETVAQTVTGTSTTPGTSTTASGYDQPTNQLIYFDLAAPTGLPGAAKLAVRVPAGREIDALDVAQHNSGATIAWTESWFSGSQYRSEVFWADLKASAGVHELSSPKTAAVGVSLAAAPSKGREVLTWQACSVGAGTCVADAALRPHGEAWGKVQTLGEADATGFPTATVSSLGQALVGWVSNGYVVASAARPGNTVFYKTTRVAVTTGDTDLALGFGSGQKAFAVWVEGTVDQKLVGARFTP